MSAGKIPTEPKTIVVAQFYAYGKFNMETYFDIDAKQAEVEIRQLCQTAHILLMMEYEIKSYKEITGYNKVPQ